ncbi:MAG: DUF2071 domain-containing protein [Bacteroidota bacterium]
MNFPYKNNPFSVVAWFDFSLTLTFAVPASELAARLPHCFQPDTHDSQWAFIAVAIVKTRGLRPEKGPKILGKEFILAGYRHFVRYRSTDNRNLRGLQIIRSETDKRSMVMLGNLFTPYSYVYQPMMVKVDKGIYEVLQPLTRLSITAEPADETSEFLPDDSVFKDWKEARKFCGPMPFTFTHDAKRNQVLVIEGQREAWKPKPMRINDFHIPYLKDLGFSDIRLSTAFAVENVPYRWEKGRKELLI